MSQPTQDSLAPFKTIDGNLVSSGDLLFLVKAGGWYLRNAEFEPIYRDGGKYPKGGYGMRIFTLNKNDYFVYLERVNDFSGSSMIKILRQGKIVYVSGRAVEQSRNVKDKTLEDRLNDMNADKDNEYLGEIDET